MYFSVCYSFLYDLLHVYTNSDCTVFILFLNWSFLSIPEPWTVTGSHAEAAAPATGPGRILSDHVGGALC